MQLAARYAHVHMHMPHMHIYLVVIYAVRTTSGLMMSRQAPICSFHIPKASSKGPVCASRHLCYHNLQHFLDLLARLMSTHSHPTIDNRSPPLPRHHSTTPTAPPTLRLGYRHPSQATCKHHRSARGALAPLTPRSQPKHIPSWPPPRVLQSLENYLL